MPDIISPGPLRGYPLPREAVSIETNKIYDCCRSKECLQDMRVYLTRDSQAALDNATGVRPVGAELLWAYTTVDPIPFNKGYYSVDIRFFYKVSAEAVSGVNTLTPLTGLTVYDKRTVLFGSDGEVKIFTSRHDSDPDPVGRKTNLPIAVVEAVDPILLGVSILSGDQAGDVLINIPRSISDVFDSELVISGASNNLYASLGQFFMTRLERETKILIPSYGNYMPNKECAGTSDEPCELFRQFSFPVDEFFPPRACAQRNDCRRSQR